MKDVTVGTGARKHTIIRAGEMYVSVSREWNTWAPLVSVRVRVRVRVRIRVRANPNQVTPQP